MIVVWYAACRLPMFHVITNDTDPGFILSCLLISIGLGTWRLQMRVREYPTLQPSLDVFLYLLLTYRQPEEMRCRTGSPDLEVVMLQLQPVHLI